MKKKKKNRKKNNIIFRNVMISQNLCLMTSYNHMEISFGLISLFRRR